MSYYGSGDYYMAGDIFGIGGAIKKLAGIAARLPGPIGMVGGLLAGNSHPAAVVATSRPPTQTAVNIALPFSVGSSAGGGTTTKVTASGQPRRRARMNVANPKALRRAIRRESGFVKLAKRALKGTGYQVTTKGSRSRRPMNIRETGPGSVVVR